jgi:hypothetical protein
MVFKKLVTMALARSTSLALNVEAVLNAAPATTQVSKKDFSTSNSVYCK